MQWKLRLKTFLGTECRHICLSQCINSGLFTFAYEKQVPRFLNSQFQKESSVINRNHIKWFGNG